MCCRIALFCSYVSSLMLCCFDFVFYIFFFKQKTAYEMRISDWSSDVCSSDLRAPCRSGLLGPWCERCGADALAGYAYNRLSLRARNGFRHRLCRGVDGAMGRLCGGRAEQAARRNDERWLNSLPQVTYGYCSVGRGSRSEERRVGTEWGSTCRSRWA